MRRGGIGRKYVGIVLDKSQWSSVYSPVTVCTMIDLQFDLRFAVN